jgi:hypothetical protein
LTWLLRLFCRHEWAPVVVTYAPPGESFLLDGAARERAMRGVTTVMRQCGKCGDCHVVRMLGERAIPPSSGKLIPLRRVKEETF